MKVLKSVHRVEALTERRRMRYVAFGLVVLLGVVGQTNAAAPQQQSKKRSLLQKMYPEALGGMKHETGQGLWQRTKSNVTGLFSSKKAKPLAVMNSGVDDGDASTAMATPEVDTVITQPVTPASQSAASSFSQRVTTGANRAIRAVTPSLITEVYDADAGKRMQALKDHRFLGKTRDGVSSAARSVGTGLRTLGNKIGGAFKRSSAAEPDASGGSSASGSQSRWSRITTSVGSGFGQLKTKLTPSATTIASASKLLQKLKPERAMLPLQIRRLNSKIAALEASGGDSTRIASLREELVAAQNRQTELGRLFNNTRNRLTALKERLKRKKAEEKAQSDEQAGQAEPPLSDVADLPSVVASSAVMSKKRPEMAPVDFPALPVSTNPAGALSAKPAQYTAESQDRYKMVIHYGVPVKDSSHIYGDHR
jgi:hypothetical protein